jgi:hypothetical protein
MQTVVEARIKDSTDDQDAIAVVSFAIIGLLASLLFATAFSSPAEVAEALLTMSWLAISLFIGRLTELTMLFKARAPA